MRKSEDEAGDKNKTPDIEDAFESRQSNEFYRY